MSSESQKLERQNTVPFLLRLFYRTGSFHKPDEFTGALPPHLHIYTWQSCTLKELTALLVSALPDILPSPSVGTRIAFRLIYPDTQGSQHGPGRYLTNELGSVVIAAGLDSDDQPSALGPLEGDATKTLQDARFVIGDYVSCAILPPLSNGEVAAAPGRPPRADFASRGPPPNRENGHGGYGGGPRSRGGGRFDMGRGGNGVPPGEWRRGDVPPGGGGFGRGRGRPRGSGW